jgi:pantetheine-phosphate adenylyltransferase
VSYEGLTAEFARKEGVAFLIRGLRNARDLAYERELAHGNEVLGQGLKTVFLLASGPNVAISSRMVRQVLRLGGLEAGLAFLPEELHADFTAWWPLQGGGENGT